MNFFTYLTKVKTSEITSFGDFILYMQIMTEESRKQNLEMLNKAECPYMLCGKKLPADLNMITFGQYQDLCDAISEQDETLAMIMFADIILDVKQKDLLAAPAYDVFGFSSWVCREVTRISDAFSNVKTSHSSEEEQAGIKKLHFGVFGILDWYARRMGITDHNKVNDVPWVRIYMCLKNDTEENEYQKRLQKVYINKQKLKK